jgi:ATP-dependent RNA helicase DDX23/PRP28
MIDSRLIALAQCVYVVMDEADRMVDLGFEPDLKFILNAMPVTNLKPDSSKAEDLDWLKGRIESKEMFRQTVMVFLLLLLIVSFQRRCRQLWKS